MASPTTAAPSEGAQPTAQPTPDSATTPTPADTGTRLAKPLRPIPSLPGVFPDEDPFPAPPPPKSASTISPSDGTGPARGADGRFLAGTSPAADVGEHAPEAGTQPTPPPTKFKIAGEEHESEDAFAQQYKSLKGQFRPLQSLARSLGGVDKIIPQFSQAAESARGWKAEADRLTAELTALKGGQPASTTDAPDEPAAEAGIDWELYAEIEKLATDSGEPWKARQWLAEQQDALVQARVTRLLDERDAPRNAEAQHQAVIDQTTNLFDSLAGYTNSDGAISFPELHDEAAAYEVGKIWSTLGFDPKLPQGAIAAIAIYRMAKGNHSQAGAAVVPTPIATRSTTPTDARAAADLGDGRTREMSVPDAGSPSADAARILSALRQSNSGNRALLGFDA